MDLVAVAEVVAAAGGPPAPPFPSIVRQRACVLTPAQCAALVARADAAFDAAAAGGSEPPPHDFRLPITREDLEGLVGANAAREFIGLGAAVLPPHEQGAPETPPPQLVRSARFQWIPSRLSVSPPDSPFSPHLGEVARAFWRE